MKMRFFAAIAILILIGRHKCVFAQESALYQDFWVSDLEAAQDSSNRSGRPIMILFSGSDWCKPCIKLRTKIIETDVFMEFAKTHLILINADFPYHKKLPLEIQNQNELLAEKYDPEGAFPKIVIVDKYQKVLIEKGFSDVSPDEFIKELSTKIAN